MFLKHISHSLLLRNLCLNAECCRPMSSNPFDIMGKRARMFDKLVKNRDKKKHWHMVFASEKPLKTKNMFEKIYMPARRMNVLNSLFIKNITDVLSTSDAAPEVMGYGMEIVDVKITIDYRTVNVYWQLPSSKQSEFPIVEAMLVQAAPKIRAELISRNVMGKVPNIFFIRDTTNLWVLEFQKNMKMVNSMSKDVMDQAPLISIEEAEKKVFQFRVPKKIGTKHIEENPEEKGKLEAPSRVLDAPADMKLNIFGLDYEKIMEKVVASKKQSSFSSETVVEPCTSEEQKQPFDAISAVPLRGTARSDIIMFCKLRKLQRVEMTKFNRSPTLEEYDPYEDKEYRNYEDHFCEEEDHDSFQK